MCNVARESRITHKPNEALVKGCQVLLSHIHRWEVFGSNRDEGNDTRWDLYE